MHTRTTLALALALCLLGCSPDAEKETQVEAQPAGVTFSGDLDIVIALAPNLQDSIQIVSAVSASPGRVNPVETVVQLKNIGVSEQRLLLQGSWHNDSGGFFGGSQSIVSLAPGQTAPFSAATRSKNVSVLKLAVSSTAATQDELLTRTLADTTPKAEGHGITYSESPATQVIPTWSVRGVANGQPFTARAVIFTPFLGDWKMAISDRDIDPFKGVAATRSIHPDVQTVNINLPHAPATGVIFERPMEYGGGYFQIKQTPTAQSTTSWNTSIAWFIEITAWNTQDYVDGGPTYQQAGTASGNLYISFKGSAGGIANSWISGRFVEAPIMYYGKPR